MARSDDRRTEVPQEAGEHVETVRRLRMVKSRHPVKPLLDSEWA